MKVVRWIDVAAALLLVAIALLLHSDLYKAAGPLWRDEIAAVRIATGPANAMAERMQFESFPILSFVAIRAWVSTGLALRMFGFVVGVLLLAAMWIAARALGANAPLLSIALAGVAASVVRFGDAVRGHGLGCVLAVLTLAALYRTVVKPSIVNWVLAALACILAVQTTYYDAVVVLAACLGAAVAHTELRNRITSIGVGAIAAASLLFYVPIFRAASRWNDLVRYDGGLGWIWTQFNETIGMSGALAAKVWIVMLLVAAILAIALRKRSSAIVYCGVALGVLIAGYAAFFAALHYLMQPWYFIVFLCSAAVLIDALVAHALEPLGQAALIRAAAAVAIAFLALADTRELLAKRWTDMDVAADMVAKEAHAGDLIVVYPWNLGVSFSQYYKGVAPWSTLPPIGDHTVHRFDEAKFAMTHPEREQALANRTKNVLASGGRIWWVGYPPKIEGMAYVGKNDAIVQADARWCDAFDAAVQSGAKHSLTLLEPDDNVTGYERPLVMGFAP